MDHKTRPLPETARRMGFTMVELLVVIGIIALLATVLFPALTRANHAARRANCLSNLREIGFGFEMYLSDHDDRFPDRRDLKASFPGGYQPWNTWPRSDPRSGWATVVLGEYLGADQVWLCPSVVKSPLATAPQTVQAARQTTSGRVEVSYWMWRFDRLDEPVPRDNFWGKKSATAIADLQEEANPFIGIPNGPSDTELTVDPYFPGTVSSLPDTLRGYAVHAGGRNRLFLDGHVQFDRDSRLR